MSQEIFPSTTSSLPFSDSFSSSLKEVILHDVVTLRALLAQNSSQEMVRLHVLRGGVVQKVDVALTVQEQAA